MPGTQTPEAGGEESAGSLRLDKWLWFARFCKSRSVAARMIAEQRVRQNGSVVVKSHALVRPGDVISLPQGPRIRVVRVLALAERRGPASEAAGLFADLDAGGAPIQSNQSP